MTARLTRLSRAALAAGTLVTLTIGGAAALTAANAAPGTGAVAGSVFDAGGYPLAGLTIKVHDAQGEVVGTASTNDAGRFRLEGVATDGDDTYRYEAIDTTGWHVAKYSPSFVVKNGVTTTTNLSVKDAGIIQGKVYTQIGTAPLKAAKTVGVSAKMVGDEEDENLPGGAVMVSAGGGFRLGGLPTGTYYVAFGDMAEVFDETCYNNVRRTQKGCVGLTYVKVTAGKATTLSRQVMKYRYGTVSGTVTDTEGHPLQGMKVDVLTSATDGSIPVTTAADGTWKKGSLDFVGKVRVRVSDPTGVHRTTWYVNATSYASATPVTMNDGSQITNLHIALPKN
ncbi:hypothetical protein ASE12_14620 [Aeromicrobium sp. Root236]|uniref:carboxypeptidase-like regulatory domain-containing protein n=1 Tax=Aeromicrobium sp. Root236 TaxID=1736498 RepID=UPI0006F544B7|nr:carboxypeptidase-like regulatory domain-containing protein [Aeromicrobium sp. Root236]KRC65884.1 hypothetical protein ASE12_14620 [Aeromicrobium sp. Root236]